MCFIAEENFEKSKNCRQPPIVQAPIPRIVGVVNGQLAAVVVRAALYMDVGVDLNAKYALMCRKTVLIPEDDKEPTFRSSATLSLTMAILSTVQTKR